MSPFEISQGSIPKEWIAVSESYIKEPSRTNFPVCATQEFYSQSDFSIP